MLGDAACTTGIESSGSSLQRYLCICIRSRAVFCSLDCNALYTGPACHPGAEPDCDPLTAPCT